MVRIAVMRSGARGAEDVPTCGEGGATCVSVLI